MAEDIQKRRERNRAYYAANAEKLREKKRLRYAADPEKHRLINMRSARKRLRDRTIAKIIAFGSMKVRPNEHHQPHLQ